MRLDRYAARDGNSVPVSSSCSEPHSGPAARSAAKPTTLQPAKGSGYQGRSRWLVCALVLVVALMADVASAQLTMDQKVADFQAVAGLYAKRYAPYEWKRDVLGFDLLNIAPWLERIVATRDDLGFYDIVSEYVSRLDDAHSSYGLPSNFSATLNFSVDVYDGN